MLQKMHKRCVLPALVGILFSLGSISQSVSGEAMADVGIPAPNQPGLVSPAELSDGRTLSPTLTIKASDPGTELLTVKFFARPAPISQTAQDFYIEVLPDTQNYTAHENNGTGNMLYAQTQWAEDSQKGIKVAFVSQVGDLTNDGDNGSRYEWLTAEKALSILEKPLPGLPDGIPYGIAIGNHDEISGTKLYNKYFGVSRFVGRSYYGGYYGTRNNDYYEFFSAGGLDFIVINLEFSPTAKLLAWANDLLHLYPMRRGIVVSHNILQPDLNKKFSSIGSKICRISIISLSHC